MDLKTEFRPIPPEIAVNPLSETPLHNMGLATMIEAALHKAEFETAAEITAWSASDFGVLLGFTPEMVREVERALGKLGLTLRPESAPSFLP